MYFGRSPPTFRRNLRPPSSGLKKNRKKEAGSKESETGRYVPDKNNRRTSDSVKIACDVAHRESVSTEAKTIWRGKRYYSQKSVTFKRIIWLYLLLCQRSDRQ
jgi:hypothetical protein